MPNKKPRIHVAPPIPTTTDVSKIEQLRAILAALELGDFYRSALLIERMQRNPRLRAVVETRCNGLLATDVQILPARQNRDARRAAEALREDWPLMARGPARVQFAKWGRMLGVAFGQRVPMTSPTSGRLLPRLQNYWPGWARWDDTAQEYVIAVGLGSTVRIKSPEMGAELDPSTSPWIVSEPFGTHSWRDALVFPASRPWLGHEWAARDQARNSEKNGIGILKAKYPRGAQDRDGEDFDGWVGDLSDMGSEGVIPCEQGGEAEGSYDVEALEYNGVGGQAIEATLNACAISLAILFLGHNLTTEIKGGSYAAAGVADYIRDDIKNADAAAENAWAGPQLIAPWAMWNFGDPGLAPRLVYVTDSPAVNQAAAQTYQALGQAVAQLRAFMTPKEIRALLERFGLPLELMGDEQVQVPAAPAPAPEPQEPAPTQESATP